MLFWFAVFTALGAAGTWMARRYALARALVDEPGERRSHSAPTPRGGGVAIFGALLVATVVVALQEPGPAAPAWAFAAGLSAVALVGLIDDHRPLSPWLRLSVHVVASGVLALTWVSTGGDRIEAAVGFLACLVLTNVWNFMDGIDGLAATQAALAAFAAVLLTDGEWTFVALALAASCLGFLPFNFPRARIFLGDVGSGALGYSIAGIGLLASNGMQARYALMLMVVSGFLLDAGLTLVRRVLRGEPWWMPHVQHAYQVCARRWGHVCVTTGYCIWTGVSTLLASATDGASTGLTLTVIAAWYISGALLWFWLQQRYGNRSRTDIGEPTGRGQAGNG